MNTSIDNRDMMNTNIMKVEPKGNGYYNVFFEFLPIPVEMNKGYLKTIIKNIETVDK